MQSGNDFPGSQVPIRERPRILPYIVLAVILALIGLLIGTIWLNWTILEHMYSLKAGLDWFSINFYGGLTFVVAGVLALLFINPIPRRSDLFEAFNAIMGLQYRQTSYGGYGQMPQRRIRPMYIRPSTLLWGFWQLLKWAILFAIFALNNGFPGFGNLAMESDMAIKGIGSWSLVPRIFDLPLHQASSTEIISLVPTMEVQYQVVVYFLQVILTVAAIRFFLKFVRDVVIRAGDKWLRDIFVTLSAITLSVFLLVPYWAMNVTIPYEWGAIVTVLGTFVGLSIYFQLRSSKETVPILQRRRLGVIAAGVVIIGLLAINLGAVTYYNLNFNNNYPNYLWDPQVSKQIAVSSWAAGIGNITTTSISNIPQGNATTTLSLIRNWDTNATETQSQNQIGVNYLSLNTPQIVFVNGTEYWVTTTTFSYPTTDWRAIHLVYTDSSKIIVMNTHTGEFVNVTQAFGIPTQPLMYYGEDNPGVAGYANDVYVGVKDAPSEINNVTYSGDADYTLCGAQRSLWFLEQGQLGYAFSPPQNCIAMLADRNVFQRVQNLLINGLVEDTSSAYLVTDGTNLYFAILVYINYPLHSGFTNVPGTDIQSYMRDFGVVLVNIANGDVQGYTLPGSDNFLQTFYKEYYPSWGAVPSWLQSQLRYPQQLLGDQQYAGQLDADFVDHVGSTSADVSNFVSGQLFYTRPPSTEVLYIPFVINNTVSFSAMQEVEYQSSSGKNLAGLYVVYGGDQLGQMYLYTSNSTSINGAALLGPTAALSEFESDATTKTELTLTDAQPGNILLYPVDGQLYYFIPAYISPSTGAAVVEKNPFVDVIDAENSSAPVTLVSTNSSDYSCYGFSSCSTSQVFANATLRTQYVDDLFTSSAITLSNGTISNANIVNYLGSTEFQTSSENQTTTTFINNFINSFVLNKTVTNGAIAFNSVFYWVPSAGTVDFGFVVSSLGVTQEYYITVVVGTT